MYKTAKLPFTLLTLILTTVSLSGCGGCGFECDTTGSSDPAPLTLNIAGSQANNLTEARITIDTITFRRAGSNNDVVVDTFTVGGNTEETILIDLIRSSSQGAEIKLIDAVNFDPGTYTSIDIKILDEDVNASYIVETDTNDQLSITVDNNNDIISTDSISVNGRAQTFTIKLNLMQSLINRETNNDYLLTTQGLRVVDTDDAVTITGEVNDDLFDGELLCQSKVDGRESGNSLYLYSGIGLNADNLADMYTSSSQNAIPGNAIAPLETTTLTRNIRSGDWEFIFSTLPPGDYTLAFSCNAVSDDPVDYENTINIPLPSNQLVEISLDEGESIDCTLDSDDSVRGCQQ